MFVNTVSVKDLFSTNSKVSSRQDPGDSAIDGGSQGNSQFPYSQVEFSDSQDAGSQPYGSGLSQSQTSDSPGKKFYQRYMSKGSVLATRPSVSGSSSVQQSFQQQLLINKAKAKDRDERDILNTMLHTVKMTASEVKDAVESLKHQVHSGLTDTSGSVQVHLQGIESRLGNYNDELLNALRVRDEVKDQLNSLQTKLAERDEQVTKLHEEIAKLKNSKESHTLTAISQLFREDRDTLKDSIQDLYAEHHSRLTEQQTHHQAQQEDLLQQTSDHHKQITTKIKTALIEIGKCVKSEVRSQCEDIQKEHIHLAEEVITELKRIQGQHLTQLQNMLKDQVSDLASVGEDRRKEVIERNHKIMVELQKRQFLQLQEFIGNKVGWLDQNQSSQMDSLLKKLGELSEKPYDAGTKSSQLDELEKLRKRHKEEMESLQRQKMERGRDRTCTANTQNRSTSHKESSYSYFRNSDYLTDGNHSAHLIPAMKQPRPFGRDRIGSGSNAVNPACSYAVAPTSQTSKGIDGRSFGKGYDIAVGRTDSNMIPPFPSPLAWTGTDWQKGKSFDPVYEFGRQGHNEEKIDMKFSNKAPDSQGFVSPLTGIVKSLNSKMLFQKPSPSPVATVHPQTQRKQSPRPRQAKKRRKRRAKGPPRKSRKPISKKSEECILTEDEANSEPASPTDSHIKSIPDIQSQNHTSTTKCDSTFMGESQVTQYQYIEDYPRSQVETHEKRDGSFSYDLRGRHNKLANGNGNATQKKDIFDFQHENGQVDRPKFTGTQVDKFGPRTYFSRSDTRTVAVAPQRHNRVPDLGNCSQSTKLVEESESEESDGILSQESSPSLSIKEVFIKHVYKKGNRTPVEPQTVAETNIYVQERHQFRGMGMTQYMGTSSNMDDGYHAALEQKNLKTDPYEFHSPRTRSRSNSHSKQYEPSMTRRTWNQRRRKRQI